MGVDYGLVERDAELSLLQYVDDSRGDVERGGGGQSCRPERSEGDT
jgi:hypothetical protein